MSIAHLLTQPLQVQAVGGPGTDEYGNALPGDVGAAVTEFGFLEQRDTTEFVNGRETTVTRWTAFLSADSTVTATGYITFGGQRFQVDGQPAQVWNPRKKVVDHVEAKLVEVT